VRNQFGTTRPPTTPLAIATATTSGTGTCRKLIATNAVSGRTHGDVSERTLPDPKRRVDHQRDDCRFGSGEVAPDREFVFLERCAVGALLRPHTNAVDPT